MESKGIENQKQTNKNRDLKLEDVDTFLEEMEGLVCELQEKTDQLPKVDKKGQSDCPFAEELYVYKEEAYEKVFKESKKLQPYLKLIEKEIVRCRKNIEQLHVDANSLNLEEPKTNYDVAEQSQKNQCDKAIYQRKRLLDLIKKIDELLELANQKEWPLGKPKHQNSFNPEAVLEAVADGRMPGFQPPVPGAYREPIPSFREEINGLISIGPLGGGGF